MLHRSHHRILCFTLKYKLRFLTKRLFFEDGFSFSKPIPSVKHCVELLKVATQIQCQNVMDVGMRFLAGLAWEEDDEKLIRDFCDSGHFAADSAGDLKVRLDFSLTKEERVKKWSVVAKRSLSGCLQFASSGDPNSDTLDRQKIFADALDVIVSDLESDMSRNLLEYVVMLLRIEAEKILKSFNNMEFWRVTVEERVVNFCWLYHMSRHGNASQVMVELILRNETMLNKEIENAEETVQIVWAGVMYKISGDLLKGQFLLNIEERLSLYSKWNWILKVDYMEDVHEEDLVEFIRDIVLIFPLVDQQYIYSIWGDEVDGGVFSQSRTAWLMLTAKEVVEGGSKLEF